MKHDEASVRSDEVFSIHADFCRIFSDPKRLRILWILGDAALSVSEIARAVGISLQNASQHLRVMRDKGAVTWVKQGQTVLYQVSNPKLLEASQMIREVLVEMGLIEVKEGDEGVYEGGVA